MVNNIADAIEEYILKQLAEKENGQVELKRTELANKISCAPSQISYVLSTRFTNERGFTVESRRGLGGYIRITIVEGDEVKKFIFDDMIRKIDEKSKFEYVKSMIDYLTEQHMLTKRESELCLQFIFSCYNVDSLSDRDRAAMIRALFIKMSKM